MPKIENWKLVRKGEKQYHWVNEVPKTRGLSPTNLLVNKEINDTWSGLVVSGLSSFRHSSKSKSAMLDWARDYMRLNPEG